MKSDKLINFGELLKKTWQYVWKFKFLWLLGLLAGGGTSMSSNNFNYLMNSDSNTEKWQSLNGQSLANNMPAVGKVLGIPNTSFPVVLIVIFALAALFLFVIFLYLNITARGAIILAVDKIEQNHEITLVKSWRSGHKYFWRIFYFSILFSLSIVLPLLFLAAPIAIMAIVRWYIPAIAVGLFFLLIFVIYAIYVSLSFQYGERILVLENNGAWDSFKLGIRFLNYNWKNVLLAYLILIALMIGAGTVLAIGILFVGGILFAIVYGIYLLNLTAAIVIAIPLGLVLFVALLIISGIISSYQSTFATLIYKEIKNSN